MKLVCALITFVVIVACVFLVWRMRDVQTDKRVWQTLATDAGKVQGVFDTKVLTGLPEPAQRYFRYTISPGAPLYTAAEITMMGELGMGDKEKPNYQPMNARQILAPPIGFVWRVRAGPISGSDGAMQGNSWTRFWLFSLVPIVRVTGDADHLRSAFGRVVAEAVFWTPASLLPNQYVSWTAVDDRTARATVSYGALQQAVDVTVDADGRPIRVIIQRWSNENSDRVFREQPFGGYPSGFREFDGYRLPTRIEGGNLIGTDDYFPFFKAEVLTLRFPQKVQP